MCDKKCYCNSESKVCEQSCCDQDVNDAEKRNGETPIHHQMDNQNNSEIPIDDEQTDESVQPENVQPNEVTSTEIEINVDETQAPECSECSECMERPNCTQTQMEQWEIIDSATPLKRSLCAALFRTHLCRIAIFFLFFMLIIFFCFINVYSFIFVFVAIVVVILLSTLAQEEQIEEL